MFAAFCALREGICSNITKVQKTSGKENVHSNVIKAGGNVLALATKETNSNNLMANKVSVKNKKTKTTLPQNKRGIDKCYHCLRDHGGKVIFVFEEDGVVCKEAFACDSCWFKATKSRVDEDSENESSASEYEYGQ